MDTKGRKQTQFLGKKLLQHKKSCNGSKTENMEQRKQISQKLQATLFSVQLLKMVLIGQDSSFVC